MNVVDDVGNDTENCKLRVVESLIIIMESSVTCISDRFWVLKTDEQT